MLCLHKCSLSTGPGSKPEADRAAALAAIEARAVANGYPPGWLTLFGSLADDNTFAAPPRGATRPVGSFKGD